MDDLDEGFGSDNDDPNNGFRVFQSDYDPNNGFGSDNNDPKNGFGSDNDDPNNYDITIYHPIITGLPVRKLSLLI